MRKGFTLIEMSVVLLIIGLLVGGIIIGKSMLRTTQVQSVMNDVAGYQTAITQFKQKYGGLPGDISNATNYWGTNPGCTTGMMGSGTQTCNGNNSGMIGDGPASFNGPFEQIGVWQHLANGGFISGQYTGVPAAEATAAAKPYYCGLTAISSGGVPVNNAPNCPGGKLSQQQFYYVQWFKGAIVSTVNYWDQPAGHYMIVGAETKTGTYPAYPLLSASEAYQLDSKVDDGLPGMGNWKSFEATGGAGYLPNCVVQSGTSVPPSDGTIASEAGAVYYVAYGSKPACSLLVNMGL